jgi:hypothetical protein
MGRLKGPTATDMVSSWVQKPSVLGHTWCQKWLTVLNPIPKSDTHLTQIGYQELVWHCSTLDWIHDGKIDWFNSNRHGVIMSPKTISVNAKLYLTPSQKVTYVWHRLATRSCSPALLVGSIMGRLTGLTATDMVSWLLKPSVFSQTFF